MSNPSFHFFQFNNNVLFILASDDLRWSKDMFGGLDDVFFTVEKREEEAYCQVCKSAIRDLAILSSCNHSIITYGTFSFWSSYLKPSLESSITILPIGYSVYPHPIVMNPLRYISTWKKLSDPCLVLTQYHIITLSFECIQHAKKYGISTDDVKRTEKEKEKIFSFEV